jgi:hypothetical protein
MTTRHDHWKGLIGVAIGDRATLRKIDLDGVTPQTQIADQERNAPEKLPGQVQSEKSISTKPANSDLIVNSLINSSNNRDGNLELSHTPLNETELAYLASKKNLRTPTL